MSDRPWFWEGNVQAALADYLTTAGWTVLTTADTEVKEAGIDILLEKGKRLMAVEVKGYPSTVYDHGPKRYVGKLCLHP